MECRLHVCQSSFDKSVRQLHENLHMVPLLDERKAGAQKAAPMQKPYWRPSSPLLHCERPKLIHAHVGVTQAAHQRVAGPLTDDEVRVVGEALRSMSKKKTWTFICTHLLPYRQPQPASARWRAHEKAHGRQAGKAGVQTSPSLPCAVFQSRWNKRCCPTEEVCIACFSS